MQFRIPSQYCYIVSILCPWARYLTLKCFTGLRWKWVPGRTQMAMCMISSMRRNGCRTVCSSWSWNGTRKWRRGKHVKIGWNTWYHIIKLHLFYLYIYLTHILVQLDCADWSFITPFIKSQHFAARPIYIRFQTFSNPLPNKLSYPIFHPLEVVSRYRDPQLQVGENHSYFFNLRQHICKSCCLNTHFIPDICSLDCK